MCTLLIINKCKKLNSLIQCLTATRPTSHNKNKKNQKGAITFPARRHNVNVLLRNSTFLTPIYLFTLSLSGRYDEDEAML